MSNIHMEIWGHLVLVARIAAWLTCFSQCLSGVMLNVKQGQKMPLSKSLQLLCPSVSPADSDKFVVYITTVCKCVPVTES